MRLTFQVPGAKFRVSSGFQTIVSFFHVPTRWKCFDVLQLLHFKTWFLPEHVRHFHVVEMWGASWHITSTWWCGVYMRIETQAFTVFMCVLGFFVESSPLTAHYCSVGTFMECLLCTEQYREEQNVLPSFYAKCLFLARFLIFLLCIMHFYAPIVSGC